MLKFSIDGSVFTQVKGAVQACVKLLDVKENGHPFLRSDLPLRLQQEVCVLHYIGRLSDEVKFSYIKLCFRFVDL